MKINLAENLSKDTFFCPSYHPVPSPNNFSLTIYQEGKNKNNYLEKHFNDNPIIFFPQLWKIASEYYLRDCELMNTLNW